MPLFSNNHWYKMKKVSFPEPKYKNVLLIDEDDIDNFINERIITSTNFAQTVMVKSSSVVALDYLRDIIRSKQTLPEIIFLDLNMPVMDGFAFLEALDALIKETGVPMEKFKVIVLSASISPADIDRASTNPYVIKYINKPLSEKYLQAINV